MSRSLLVLTALNGLYVDKRAIMDLPFTKNFYKKEKMKKINADDKRQKNLFLFVTRSSQLK